MNTNIFRRKSRIATSLALALLLGGFGIAQAQPSPVGTWDCALGKPWMGTAYITFGSDFTINGIQIMTPPLSATNSYDAGKHTNSFGGAVIANGEWHFQNSKVVGFYTEVGTQVQCSNYPVVTTITLNVTNGGIVTNVTTTVTNIVENCTTNSSTNSVSFEASVKPGKKIKIKATIADGRSTSLKGVPATALPDISGFYYGDGRNNGAPFNEFFTLTLADPSVNGYDLNGQGPGYSFSGFALLSKKSVSFYATDISSNSVLRAITGPMNTAKGSAMLKGYQGFEGSGKITYKVTKQPVAPPPPPAD